MSPIPLGFWATAGAGGGGGAAAYELIESSILASNQSEVVFSSIPNTYKHLQIRYTAQVFEASSIYTMKMKLNSDSGANWGRHYIFGDGGSIYTAAQSNAYMLMRQMLVPDDYGTNANIFAAGIIDFLDYANTSKNTTVRAFGANPYAGTYRGVCLHSGVWLNTSAVSSITISSDSPTSYPLKTGSRFSLYGLKG